MLAFAARIKEKGGGWGGGVVEIRKASAGVLPGLCVGFWNGQRRVDVGFAVSHAPGSTRVARDRTC